MCFEANFTKSSDQPFYKRPMFALVFNRNPLFVKEL